MENESVLPVLKTERLELWHMSVEDMQAINDDPSSLTVWQSKPFENPYGVFVGDVGPIPWRIPQAKEDPATNKWFIRVIVDASTREAVGSVSFHGPPDDNGMLEVGLGIVESQQRKGYATEALLAFWSWAARFPDVRTFRYCVGVDNSPSLGLIQSLGFSRVGQQIDPVDGPEEMYEMDTDEFRRRYMA